MGYNGSYVNSYTREGSKLKYDTIITGDVAEGNNPYSVAVIYVTGTLQDSKIDTFIKRIIEALKRNDRV